MAVTLNSSQVQQNFGAALDRALRGDDVIVERYGTPRAAIVEYERYQKLVAAAQEQGFEAHPGQLNETAAVYRVGGQTPALPAGNAEAAAPVYRYITRSPGILGGRPIIRGTRVPVKAIVGYYKLGMSADEILDSLPHLTPAQVYEALSYYHDHVDEIEREIQEDQMERLTERHGFSASRLLGELEAVLKSLPSLGAAEAASFANDIAEARAQLPQEERGDPWAS